MLRNILTCVLILAIQYHVESKNAHLKSHKEVNKDGTILPQHNGTKRTVEISQETKKKAMQVFAKALDAFTEYAIGDLPFAGKFYDLFKQMTAKTEKPLWEQIRGQVQHSIDKSMVENDLDHVDRELRKIERRISEGDENDKLTGDDYRAAIDLMEEVFPHKREAIPWSDELPLRTLYYCTIIIQVYQIRIEEGDAEKCSLGKRLVEIRQEIIFGMKEMIRKRYRQIKEKSNVDSVMQYVNFTVGTTGEFSATRLADGKDEQLGDGNTNPFNNNRNKHYYSWNYQIKKIENEVIDFLMSEVVDKINNFFTQDLCFEGCECPEPIQSTEIALEWPAECLGYDPKDESKKCSHPCGKFDKNYNWCYDDESSWLYCTPMNIRCCIKMPYDSRPNRCADKKKKKAKKMSSKLLAKENKKAKKEKDI